jgi:N-glycosylase/DNA lyase
MIKIEKNDINLNNTITCGQIFRYTIKDDKYTILLDDRVVELYEDDKYIYVTSSNECNLEEKIMDYLDLNRNYELINKELIAIDSSLKEVIKFSRGFKIINQYPFETMISYIISANNSVRNIHKSVNLISEKYGKKIEYNNNTYYLFPTINELKSITIEELNSFKLGFRSKYIYEFVNTFSEESIEYIRLLNTEDAIKYLMTFKGIGLKVASCILLFSYKRLDVFPIDTWVKKYMIDNYDLSNVKDIEKYTKEKYGKYSGLVIQYFFNSKRNKQN